MKEILKTSMLVFTLVLLISGVQATSIFSSQVENTVIDQVANTVDQVENTAIAQGEDTVITPEYSSQRVGVQTNEKFEIKRKSKILILNYKDMIINFIQVNPENEAKFSVSYKGESKIFDLGIGKTMDIFGTKITLLGLKRTGKEILKTGQKDFVATMIVKLDREEPTPEIDKVKITLYPEKQYTKTASAKYKVHIEDLRKFRTGCFKDEKGKVICIDAVPTPIEYKLSFESKNNMKWYLEKDSVTLLPGEGESLELKVTAEDIGTNYFSVTAKGKSSSDTAKGALIFDRNDYPEPPKPVSYFEGTGFMKAGRLGYLVDLKLLNKNGKLLGKINANNQNSKVEGNVKDNGDMEFIILDKKGKKEASFVGTITDFEDFKLIEGDIYSGSEGASITWHLIVTSKKEKTFIEVEEDPINEEITATVGVEDVITINPKEKTLKNEIKDVYITPKGIAREKIMGLIPNPWGEKILKVEVMKDGETITKTIKPFQKKIIGGYEVEIGSLENNDNIDFSVKKPE